MPSLAYSASGRLTLNITWQGLTHKMRFPCILNNVSAYDGKLLTRAPFAGNVTTGAAAQQAWENLVALYQNNVSPPSWLLEQDIGGIFIPIDNGSLVNDGSATVNGVEAGEITYTFKDSNNHRLKLIALETIAVPPQHSVDFVSAVALNALVRDMFSPGSSAGVGCWVYSRTAAPIARCVGITVALNKRVRRSRHTT